MKALPNSLTFTRFVIALIFPFIPQAYWLPAVVLAAATEFFDGWTARRWNLETNLGRQMDPVADKLFIIAVGYTFHDAGLLSIQDILLLAARDLTVIVGGFLAWAFGLGKDFLDVRPRFSGKAATTMQFVLILAIAALHRTEPFIFWVTVFMSLLSAADYFALGIRRLRVKFQKSSK